MYICISIHDIDRVSIYAMIYSRKYIDTQLVCIFSLALLSSKGFLSRTRDHVVRPWCVVNMEFVIVEQQISIAITNLLNILCVLDSSRKYYLNVYEKMKRIFQVNINVFFASLCSITVQYYYLLYSLYKRDGCYA